jgi:cytoskeletal protein RodZ
MGEILKMRHVTILLIAFILVFTACSKQNASPAQTNQPGSTPSGSQTPAPGSSGTPANPPANNADPAKPGTPPPPTPAPAAPAPAPAPKGAQEQPVASKTQFDAVQIGMTYDEVSKNMGELGKMTSETKDETGMNVTQTYEYKKSEGGTLKVTFRNGKVANKSESSQ